MKRTDTPTKRKISHAGEWITTAYHLSKKIPHCETLQDFWIDWSAWDDDRLIPDIKKEIQRYMNNAFDQMESEQIAEAILPIRANKKFRYAIIPKIRPLLKKRYRMFLDSDNKILPQAFGIIVPFIVDRTSTGVELPIEKSAGNTRLFLNKSMLKAEDGQLWVALGRIMRSKICETTREGVYFKTDEIEINKTMKKSQPHVKRPSIMNGLRRLRSCELTIVRGGVTIITGLITKIKINRTSKHNNIEVMIDRDFLESLDKHGYIDIDPDVSFELSPAVHNLYVWLRNQDGFKKFKKIPKIDNRKLYERIGYGGKTPEQNPDWRVRETLKNILKTAKKHKLIDGYQVGDKSTRIGKSSKKKL